MSARPARGRFVAGFVTGAVLAAVATAGAQGAYVRFGGGYGLQPGSNGFVVCTNAALTEIRAGISPVPGYMPLSANGVRQNALTVTCPS